MKKVSMALALLAVAMTLVADTQSEWYASLSNKREATEVYVGKERWRSNDKDKPLPYRFACGAVLHSTAGGKRLDLNNVAISDGGISANGDLALFLAGSNYVVGEIGGHYAQYSLLFFGLGSLTVKANGECIHCGDLSICAGPAITAIGGEMSAANVLISMSSVLIQSSGIGLSGSNINILGSAVAIHSGSVSLGSIGCSNVVIDGSVVSIMNDNSWRGVWTGLLSVSHSYFSCVVPQDGWGCICASQIFFDNSIAKLYSKESSPLADEYVGNVVFGEGDYYIASGSQAYAVGGDGMTVKGGNVQICSASEESSAVNVRNFQIDSGRFEIVDKIDVRDFLKYDAAAAALYTGVVADGTIDVSSFMANFYSQVILNAISNAKIGDLNGVPNVGIDCSSSSSTYIQNGGTVWCDLPKRGVMCYKSVMNGGSYKGQFYSPSYSYTVSGGHDPVSPVNSSGNMLKCVSYAVAGAKKYDKITQSWSGILPSYYGTGSLYADAAGKLYFWVPENWNVPGGSSGGGGGGSGGGSGGGVTADVDLEPYTPRGWSAPLAFSTGYYSDSAESDTFRTANTVYAKIAFHNEFSTTISSTFRVAVYVDGALKYSKDINGIEVGRYHYVIGINLGSFDEGTHTVKMVVDSGGVIPESDESDNTYTRTFMVSNPAQYTIFFYRNAKPNDREVSWDHVGINENYPLPTMAALKWSKEGDTFLGWATSATAKAAQYVAGQSVCNLGAKGSNVDLYGVWQSRVSSACTITFNANGGSVTETTRSLAYGSTLGTLPLPVRQGYSFDGWYTSVDGYGRVNSSTVVTGSATYYAHWSEDKPGSEHWDSVTICFDIEMSYVTNGDGAFMLDLASFIRAATTPRIIVKGLPAGLKFDSKTGVISGKATKPGVYKVTVSATNKTVKKPVTKTFELVVPNLASEVLPWLEQDTDAYGVVTCGVAFDPGVVDCAPEDGWTVKAAGLPTGLKFVKDKTTGAYSITGVPTKAGTFTVTFTASKKGEKNQIATITLNVEAAPDWAVGTFSGWVRRVEDNAPYQGSATMTVAANGKISGKMALCGTNWTFKVDSFNRVERVERVEESLISIETNFVINAVATAGKAKRAMELRVEAADSGCGLVNAKATGESDDGEWSIELWRGMWKDKATAAVAKTEIAKWQGLYTLSLDPGDGGEFGSGYLSLTVGKDGNVKATGKLADGTSVSATTPLLHDGETGFLAYVYAAPSAYKGGSLALAVGFEDGGGRGVTSLPGMPARWTSRNPQATGEYGEGFSRDVDFFGAYYDKLQKLNAYYESLRVSLDGAPNLGYVYKETDFNELGRKVTVSENREADAIETLWQDGMTVAVNEKGAIVVAKATKPVQDKTTKEWSYDGTNDGALTLSFTQATGIFKGSYTFWYDYESAHDNTTGKSTMTHTSKKVSFEGIMVQGEDPKMDGFYLWDATGSYKDPKTGKPKTYKYKESHGVSLTP